MNRATLIDLLLFVSFQLTSLSLMACSIVAGHIAMIGIWTLGVLCSIISGYFLANLTEHWFRDAMLTAKQLIILCAVPILPQPMLDRFSCWLIPDWEV